MTFKKGTIEIKKPRELRYKFTDNGRQSHCEYECDCGCLFTTRRYQVKSSKAKSCGCLARFIRGLNVQKIKYLIKQVD